MRKIVFILSSNGCLSPFLFTLFIVVLTEGCVKTPSGVSPASSPALPRQIETDAVIKGIRAYEDGQYHEAAALFMKAIESYPGSSLLMEAQWHLAKSYRAAGQLELAHRELTLFLKNYSGSPYEKEARFLLKHLEVDSDTVFAVVVSHLATPSLKTLLHLNPLGVNTVILEIPEEDLKKNALSLSKSPTRDPLYESIRSIRKAKFRVLIKIPLRNMKWAVLQYPHWRDQKYDSPKRVLKTIEALDLFHPEAKKMLLTLCRNIARYPVDGIYVEQIAYGIEEGYSPFARGHYQKLFLEKLQIEKVFKMEKGGKTRSPRPNSPQFWRFAGLKSRYLTDLLREMGTALRSVQPEMELGVGIPDLLLVDPVAGLAQYSLDYLELKEAQLDFYVVTSIEASPDKLVASLIKYGRKEKVWFQSPQGAIPYLHRMPIQGIVVPYP